MDEVNKIRKCFFNFGENKNQIAKKFNRSWGTINCIVNMKREEFEDRGKRPRRSKRVITPEVIEAIEHYFEEEQKKNVKKKQRYTASQIYKELKEKKIYKGSIRSIQQVVSMLRAKYGQLKKSSFLPLDFPLGSALQMDHGECDVKVNGIRVTGYLFVASLPGQVLRYCQIFPIKSREAWGEFHERAFLFFGGIFSRIIYDNDTVLVKKIIGSEREQTDFSLSLEEHYMFESHFCNIASGNEKGAVENGVKYCRRRFLAGLPSFKDWESVNKFLQSCCTKDINKGLHYKTGEKLSDLFQKVKESLTSLPIRKVWRKWVERRVDKCQLVTIDSHQYSVPERFIGSTVRIALSISRIEIFKDRECITFHQRHYGKKDSLILDHYLDQLKSKPSAFPYAKAVTQNGFHPRLLEIRERLSDKYGNKEANRQFVSILLLRRQWSQEDLLKGVEQALDLGAIDCSAIETILRQKQLSKVVINQEEVRSLIPINNMKWDFNINHYGELCKEISI